MTEQQDAHVHAFDREHHSFKDYTDRETWLLARRAFLTSTDVGAIVGVDRFSSAIKVYADKMRKDEDLEDNSTERMLVGRAMQDGVGEAYRILRLRRESMALAIEAVPSHRLYFHARHPLHAASMDFWQTDLGEEAGALPLEVKTWAGGPIEEPLPSWLTQVQWQMHVTGTERATIAVAAGFGEVKWWDIDRDQEVIDQLCAHAENFYEAHIKPGIPPASDGSDSARDAMRELYSVATEGQEIELTLEHVGYANEIAGFAETIKGLTLQKRVAEDAIKQIMRDATVAYLPDGRRITWKEVIRKAHMVKESASRQFRILKGAR